MVKRSTFLILTTVVILCVILVLTRNRSPFGRSNTSFASDIDDEITRIEFRDGRKELILEKKDNKWVLNGEKEARKSGINFILKILREMEIKSPVSQDMFNSLIEEKGVIPVNVKTFKKRKLLRTFLVYKTGSNIYGNIMKMNDKAKPYIVHVPGYEGNVGSGFTVNDLFWQAFVIFNLLPSEILSVEFENLTDTLNSFSIMNKNGNFIFAGRDKEMTRWDTTRVKRYLTYFTHIPFESWAFDLSKEERKAVESRPPLYRITVTPVKGDQIILTLWEKQRENVITDTDRLYGKTNSADELFIVRFFDIDPLLKKLQYFY